jgi:hypothetical protein
MSNDPFQAERSPLPYPGEPSQRPLPPDPYAAAFGSTSDPKKAKGRLLVPGILIILVGLLNLLPGIGCGSIGLMMNTIPDSQMDQMAAQHDPQGWKDAQKEGYTAQSLKNIYLYSGLSVAGFSLFMMLLAVVGGGCMIAGRSMLLCSIGALAAILSPGGFGLLGLAVGIWALVVLLSEDVRAAFRAV